jgi:hypothetical protein
MKDRKWMNVQQTGRHLNAKTNQLPRAQRIPEDLSTLPTILQESVQVK